MIRTKPIAALEKAQRIASCLYNDAVREFKAAGGKVVGTFDPEVPFEIFEAAGLLPFDMRGTGATSTEYADKYFRQLTCEFTRTVFNELVRGEYDFLDGAVVYNCCDHLRRIDDNWKTLPNPQIFHFFYVPKLWSEATYPRFCDEVKKLIAAVEQKFDVRITPEKLSKAIALSNQTHALIRELYDLRKGDAVYLDGAEMAAVLTAGGSIPREQFNALLSELIAELKASGETVTPKARLMFLAGHAGTPELLETLESQGGVIVIDDAANGLRMAQHDIDESIDPIEALCNFYFNVKDPMPRAFGTQSRRMQTYAKLAEDFRVDGAVTARLTMCDVWAFEQYILKKLFEEKGLPSMELEVNYILDGQGQIRTRVQAFVESLTH